jgi:hypothetical protein
MAWRLAEQEAPELIVTKDQTILWNETAHAMMEFPRWVDLLYDPDEGKFAVVGVDNGAYGVRLQDTGYYLIACFQALKDMGMADLHKDYVARPEVLEVTPDNPGPPYVPGQTRFNGIWTTVQR